MVFTLVQELQDRVNDWADNIYNKQVEEKEEREKVNPSFYTNVYPQITNYMDIFDQTWSY